MTTSVDPTRIDLETDSEYEVDPRVVRMRGVARHGNTPFDVPFISHIEGNLWTGGCASGLVLPQEFKHVISLYPWEQYDVYHELASLSLHWLYDSHDIPKSTRLFDIASYASGCIHDAPTLIHCQAGLNRSGLIAALVLIVQGRPVPEAIDLLREKRSPAVLCNTTFESWLRSLEA